MSVTTFVEPHTICSLRLSTILYTHRYTGDFQSPTMDTWCSTPTQRAASPPSPPPAQAAQAQAVVKESRAAMMELEAARVSMREQLLVARAESEEQKAQLAGLLRSGGLYGYGH